MKLKKKRDDVLKLPSNYGSVSAVLAENKTKLNVKYLHFLEQLLHAVVVHPERDEQKEDADSIQARIRRATNFDCLFCGSDEPFAVFFGETSERDCVPLFREPAIRTFLDFLHLAGRLTDVLQSVRAALKHVPVLEGNQHESVESFVRRKTHPSHGDSFMIATENLMYAALLSISKTGQMYPRWLLEALYIVVAPDGTELCQMRK